MTVLKRERESRGVTATAVAAAVGIDQSYYSKIENGKAAASPEVAEKLAAYFGNTINELQILYPHRYAAAAS